MYIYSNIFYFAIELGLAFSWFFFEVPIGAEASAEALQLVYSGLCNWPQ